MFGHYDDSSPGHGPPSTTFPCCTAKTCARSHLSAYWSQCCVHMIREGLCGRSGWHEPLPFHCQEFLKLVHSAILDLRPQSMHAKQAEQFKTLPLSSMSLSMSRVRYAAGFTARNRPDKRGFLYGSQSKYPEYGGSYACLRLAHRALTTEREQS
jgi:hypothetical protein